MQKAIIIGKIVADAELRQSQEGHQFIVFRVRVKEKFGDEERSTFFDVTYPNGKILDFLKQGKMVYVSGRLSHSIYTAKDGSSRVNFRISGKEIDLCGVKEGEGLPQ